MSHPNGVIVLHGPTSLSIAARLAMDIRSAGIPAHPVALEIIQPSDWEERLPGVTGVVIIYDGQTWILSDVETALDDIHPNRPVVFVRTRSSKFNPSFHRFHVAPAFDAGTFSHYQPTEEDWGGYLSVIEFLSGALPVTDASARGFAFVSYSSQDKKSVDDVLIPALAACDIGFFDYRFTARLDEKALNDELQRRIKRCAMVIARTSPHWHASKHTALETSLASRLGKPLVLITLPGEPAASLAGTPCGFTGNPDTDARSLRIAIERALEGTEALALLPTVDAAAPLADL